jgi:chromosome segregation ATPase
MSATRMSGNRRNNAKFTPFVSPADSVSPIDARMTPIRKSLFQSKRLTSNRRRKDSFAPSFENDSRDDSSVIENLRSANKKKDGHLKILHDRFTSIQKGLGSIDQERNELVEKAKRLDKEKKVILKQLELREREILSLIKRCASQEEKMRESNKLKSTNKNLQNHLDVMAKKIEVIEAETQDRENLQKMLKDSEIEREQLKDRLETVQREHDAIADTLQKCLGDVRQLTEEKRAVEEERRKERKQAEIELEKQHEAHAHDSNTLKENIKEHQSRILQMENLLQDKIKSNTDLRREKAIISQGKREEIQEVVEKYERQLKELRNEIEETMTEHKKGSQEEVRLMKMKLKTKDDLIKDLESEFSDQMENLISKQSSLDEAEEKKKDLELKVESTSKLEIEHAALLDFVEILDSNLAELTSTNAHLELEKDTLREETDALRKKADMLQKQLSSLQSDQKARKGGFRDLINARNERLQLETQESLRQSKSEIISLQAELQSRNEHISRLEIDLRRAQNMIADKENEMIRLVNQLESLRSNLGADLKRARLQAAQFEAEVFAKNQTLASLEGRLEGAKEMREVGKNFEPDGEINTEKARSDVVLLGKKIEYLHERLQSKEIDSKKIREELETTIQKVRNEAMFLQQKIESLSEEKAMVEKEVETSRTVINDRDQQIVEIQQILLKHKRRAHDLESKLPDNYKELEEKIRMLEEDLLEAQNSQSESTANLKEAHETIEKLEQQLIGEDSRTQSLQNQLVSTANDLIEQESKARSLQKEHENFNEETLAKISFLEGKIEELKIYSSDLGVQIEDYRKENSDKDDTISSLRKDLVEGQREKKEIRSELHLKCTELENLELLLTQKDEDLKLKIETTNSSLKSKEDRIAELEKFVSSNEGNVKNLQDSLSKAKDDILKLEDRISHEEEDRMALRKQLRDVDANSTKTESVDEDFLPSSDESDLKQKIQTLLSRQADLTNKLNRSNAILKEERESWNTKEQNSYEELAIHKAKLLVLQNVLIERERAISSLQQRENEDELYETVISHLEVEVKLKEEKINDFERQFVTKEHDGIQYAFVESDKRRLQVEDELTVSHDNFRKLVADSNIREKKLGDVLEALEKSQEEVAEKNKGIFLAERHCKFLEENAKALDEQLRREKEQFMKLTGELKSTRTEMREKEQMINDFKDSTRSLNKVAEKASDEISRKDDIVAALSKTADNLKITLENAEKKIAERDNTIECLEDGLKIEIESRKKLEGEIAVMKENVNESETANEDLEKNSQANQPGNDTVEENLSEARKAFEELNHTSSEHISRLESQISEMKEELTRKDIEIRDLRLVELMSVQKTPSSSTKEAAFFKADALEKNLENTTEKESFISRIQNLNSKVQTLSSKGKGPDKQRDTTGDSMRKTVDSLKSSKLELELNVGKLTEEVNRRDATIQELKEALLQDKQSEAEIWKEREALQKAESDARDQLDIIKAEYEQAAAREKELINTKLRNKDSLHKEELEHTLVELESTLNKLQDSESLLAEKNSRLNEMVIHCKDIESELDKEETERRELKKKFVNEQNDLKTARADLKKIQAELVRKESILESKLKEERHKKEYAEESLRIAKTKYKEAVKIRRSVTDLERENGELKDKIRRQEAYLQRKLQKEKADRARFTPGKTPGKSVVSPRASVPRTPSRRTPTQETPTNQRSPAKRSASKEIPPSSKFSRSKLQAPSTTGLRVNTGVTVPAIPKSRSMKTSPTAASCRSVFSRSTHFQTTPSNQASIMSPQDILQAELDDDRSGTSELSF